MLWKRGKLKNWKGTKFCRIVAKIGIDFWEGFIRNTNMEVTARQNERMKEEAVNGRERKREWCWLNSFNRLECSKKRGSILKCERSRRNYSCRWNQSNTISSVFSSSSESHAVFLYLLRYFLATTTHLFCFWLLTDQDVPVLWKPYRCRVFWISRMIATVIKTG